MEQKLQNKVLFENNGHVHLKSGQTIKKNNSFYHEGS